MITKILAVLMAALLSTSIDLARAQSPAKIPRIGLLSTGPAGHSTELLRDALRELGYVDGRNVLIEPRYTGDEAAGALRLQRLQELATDLVRLPVDVIVTTERNASEAAKRATSTIPIVGGLSGDPVRTGLIASVARPGGNITGVMSISAALYGKRLELLKEVLPKVSPVAVLWIPETSAENMKEIETAARALSLELQPAAIQRPEDFKSAFLAMRRGGASSLLVINSPMFFGHRAEIADLAAKNGLPAIYGVGEWVDDGGLMSYGDNIRERFRRIAQYVDRILKGAKPADLPVGEPTKFELVINRKAAKQIGLTIPSSVLSRADRIIPEK